MTRSADLPRGLDGTGSMQHELIMLVWTRKESCGAKPRPTRVLRPVRVDRAEKERATPSSQQSIASQDGRSTRLPNLNPNPDPYLDQPEEARAQYSHPST